jgi:GT2 family glycosyltransferase
LKFEVGPDTQLLWSDATNPSIGDSTIANQVDIDATPTETPALAPTSVVIVNFNAGEFLATAVESALAQDDIVEIFVVDNNSVDNSLDVLRTRVQSPILTIIELDDNYGFAHACNVGAERATGATLLFLNPDCEMKPHALEQMRLALAQEPGVGMAGPLLVNPDGSEQRGCRRDIPTPWQIFCVALLFHKLMPNHPRFDSFNHDERPLPKDYSVVQAISGACMLVTRDAMDKVGALDQQFFLHFEDLDWCLRFDEAGYKIVFTPHAVVEHTRGVCGRSQPVRVEYHKHKSLITFLRKHFTKFYPSSFMAVVYVVVAMRFIAVLLTTLLGLRKDSPAAWERLMTESSGSEPRAEP